jgi:uncharacterized membrane protein YfcA
VEQFLLPLLGLAVGLVLALTGAGGAIIAAPLLVFGLGLKLAQAAPVALLAVTIAAGTGAILGFLTGELRYKAAGLMALAGLAASPVGLWLAQRTPDRPLLVLFAAVLAGVAARTALQASRELSGRQSSRPALPPCRIDPAIGRLHWNTRCAWVLAWVGALAGLLSGLLGVGGGFVMVPALLMATDLPTRAVMATSMGVIALVSAGGVASAAIAGWIDVSTAWPFALGALIGMLSGRAWSRRLSGPRLQQGFAALSGLVAVALVWRAA